MEQGKGRILYPDEINEKTDDTTQTVLESEHPDARTWGANVLTHYPFLAD
jgi:hypothetical protein